MKRIADRVALARDVLPKHGQGAELGVCAGDFAEVLYRETQPVKLFLVDLWQQAVMGYSDASHAQAKCRDRFVGVDAVQLVCDDTVRWLAAQPASSLDWVYIDSNHRLEQTTRELGQALRVVRAGGWICGHDYGAFSLGVVQAVNEFNYRHGQRIAWLTDEPETPPRIAAAWMPSVAACNSFAIQVEK